MNIGEAIKIKEEDLKRRRVYYDPNLLEADRLSIEALKHEKLGRELGDIPKGYLLPGETKD